MLLYAAEAWFGYLSKHQKDRIEAVQQMASKIICPTAELTPIEHLVNASKLRLLKLIEEERTHLLHSALPPKKSERFRNIKTNYITEKCNTEKRMNSFFPSTARLK